ncbi:MAG: ABC transporter permease subunit [Bacteroidota bacterium]
MTWILARRELRSYFDSPAAYIVLSLFLLITGWFFGNALFLENVASLRNLFGLVPVIYLFFVPALTMATFAEERRSGTIELLLTMPVRDWEVILGKLLAVTSMLAIALGLTLIFALTVASFGDLDFGATFGGYLGLLLLGLASTAIGLFASSVTRNQIVAFILGFALLFFFFMLDKATFFVPGWMAGTLEYLSTDFHYQNLLRGVIDSRDIIYYLSLTTFFVLLTGYNLARRAD